MNTWLVLIGFLLFTALNIVPLLLNADYQRKHGKSLLAQRWSVWHLLYAAEAGALILFFLTSFYFAGLSAVAKPLGLSIKAITDALSKGEANTPQLLLYFFFPVTILQNLVFFLIPAAVISGLYEIRLRDIGMPALPPRRAVIAGVVLGLIFIAVSGSASYGLEHLAKHYSHIPFVEKMLEIEKTNPVAQMAATLKKAGIPGLILGVLTVGIAAPFGEEMLFRGFALNTLARRFGGWVGIVLSALLFAAPHSYSLIGQSVIFLMGLGLGYVYRNSGSLWIVVIIHAINNTGSVVFAYFR